MNYGKRNSLGLTHLILQFLVTFIIGIVLSIFTMTVHAFVMLFGHSVANSDYLKLSDNSYQIPHCSICQKHSLSNATQPPDSSII